MNKKSLLTSLIFLPCLAFAQEDILKSIKEETKNDTARTHITALTKNIEYEILIKEGDRILLKTNFNLKNGKEFSFLIREQVGQATGYTQKSASLNNNEVYKEMSAKEVNQGEREQIKLTVNIGTDTNLSSDFSFRNFNIENSKKVGLLQGENNANATEDIPLVSKSEEKISIIHMKNKETSFTWNTKEVYLKAKYQ